MHKSKASHYQQQVGASSPAELVERHADLVKKIALHIAARLPDSVQLDDLIQAGVEGLIEAANNFKEGKGAKFSTYAGIRIRGAILDEMRRGDWSPRSVHRNARRVTQAQQMLEAALGREPKPAEVAKALKIELDEYQKMLRASLGARLSSLDEPVDSNEGASLAQFVASEAESPEEELSADQQRRQLAEALAELPERDQLLLNLYYFEELNLKEIGAVLEVSESRVSQLHSQAAQRLRRIMAEK